jgi:chromosome partitioning protein
MPDYYEDECQMIVTVGNTKGGVGKTTLAFQLALLRALAVRDVLLVDGDRQGSAQTAVSIRADANRMPGLSCAQYPEGSVLRAQVQRQASKYDDVVIDAGGRDSAALRAAMVLSDVLLVPFLPRSVDVWALGNITSLIEEVRSLREGLRAFAVLNAADPGVSSDNTDALAALTDFPQLVPLEVMVVRRKAFANAVGLGLSVEELTPRDPKACQELAALQFMVFDNETPMKLTAIG